MLSKELHNLIKKREFISVATCDFDGNPSAVPKFMLRADASSIYLVDYTIGKTWENLKINPRISLAMADTETLKGYKISGTVEIIDQGKYFFEFKEEVEEKLLQLSVERIIEGVKQNKPHKTFEVAVPQTFVIYKVTIKEVVEIGPSGQLTKKTKRQD